MQAYCVDLDKSLDILDFSGDELAYDLEYYNVRCPTELSEPDRRVFLSLGEATAWLTSYRRVLKTLPERCKRDPTLPCMLLKRRYIVQVLMGLKTYTQRSYKKNWDAGQLFQFHDQTYFLTVRLTSLTQTIDKDWKYTHKLP